MRYILSKITNYCFEEVQSGVKVKLFYTGVLDTN